MYILLYAILKLCVLKLWVVAGRTGARGKGVVQLVTVDEFGSESVTTLYRAGAGQTVQDPVLKRNVVMQQTATQVTDDCASH